MSLQESDKLIYKGVRYSVVGHCDLFEPERYGLHPKSRGTSNLSGYVCTYKVMDEYLYLTELVVRSEDEASVVLNDHLPRIGELGDMVYEDITMKLDFTGIVTIGDRSIRDPLPIGGYAKGFNFIDTKELYFEDGRLIQIRDCSELGEIIRECIAKGLKDKQYKEEVLKYIYANFEESTRHNWIHWTINKK